MNPRTLCFCVGILLAGCAAERPASDADARISTASPPLPLGQADMAMNVQGGRYHQLAIPIAENDAGLVELTLEHVNPDPRWAALANLCVQGDPSSDQVCIRIQHVGQGSQELQATQVRIRGDGKALLASEDLTGKFRLGNTIKISVRNSPGSVQFRINDGQAITRTLPFTPRVLIFGCSSVLCRARVD